jgi:hypothetical protein
MKFILAVIGLLILSVSFAMAQDTRSPNSKFLDKRGYTFPDSVNTNILPRESKQWPDTLYYSTMYKARLMGSLTIPITFSSVRLSNGEAIVGSNFSLGLGYTWFYGNFVFNEDDKMTISPTFFFGVLGAAGIGTESSFSKIGGFLVGGFIGVGAFTLFGGYDLINRYALVGIGARVDFFTFSQKFLHVFGKVHEMRKHKTIAKPITGE